MRRKLISRRDAYLESRARVITGTETLVPVTYPNQTTWMVMWKAYERSHVTLVKADNIFVALAVFLSNKPGADIFNIKRQEEHDG